MKRDLLVLLSGEWAGELAPLHVYRKRRGLHNAKAALPLAKLIVSRARRDCIAQQKISREALRKISDGLFSRRELRFPRLPRIARAAANRGSKSITWR